MKGSSIILDEEQQKAIEDNSKALAIISGPGSGKTRTLVEKARHESRKGNSVIALTFTRNAAQEIRDRAPDVTASTIHSFCYQHLQKFPGDYDELLENYLLLLDKPKYDVVAIDECLPGRTRILISTKNSNYNNKSIRIDEAKVGDYILSYNETTGTKEPDKIVKAIKTPNVHMMVSITLSNGNELTLTDNHPVYTVNKGWTKSNKLDIGDKLLQHHYEYLNRRISKITWRGKTGEQIYGKEKSEQRSKKISETMTQELIERWAEPNSPYRTKEFRELMHEVVSGPKPTYGMTWEEIYGKSYADYNRKKRSQEVKDWFESLDKEEQEEINKKRSESYKEHLDSLTPHKIKEIHKRQIEGLNRKPNKLELAVNEILERVCPKEFGYNGDLRLGIFINHHIPDFWNINGKKKVIETLGSHPWHYPEEAREYIEDYKEVGVDCLIIWDYELKHPITLEEKILNFVYNPDTEVVTITKKYVYWDESLNYVYNLETEKNHNFFAQGILVHNCQDLSALEFRVVLSLIAKGGKLFMVGDPSQSIFGYCEAEGAQISKTGIKKLFLTRNYRSSKEIVTSLEKMNLRQLTSVNREGNPKVKGTAVLFRENSQLDAVALHLINMGFCFRVRKRGMKFPGEIVGGSNGSHSTENPDIIFSVIHCSKGCEWEKVVCWDWGMRKIEKNLYYVALARASKEFHLINSMSELYQLLKE